MEKRKNIHLLPTDKPSRLSINTCFDNVLELWDKIDVPEIKQDNCIQDYNIYITSDEEIKEGDWHFKNDKMVTKSHLIDNTCKKIILTTDQDLIANGVQAIDDDFLEWFVKNPSCEEVPIIPKLFGHPYIIWIEGLSFKEEPKEETIEEATERLQKDKYGIFISKDADVKGQLVIDTGKAAFSSGMNEGAKWMQERMYSEEELKHAINLAFVFSGGMSENETYQDCELFCLEQFKKKQQ